MAALTSQPARIRSQSHPPARSTSSPTSRATTRHRRQLVRRGRDETDGKIRIAWQRDWFDLGSTAHTFIEIAKSGKAPQAFLDRIGLNGMDMPGHYRYADLPSTLWPPQVEQGQYVTQNPLGQ